MQVGVARWAIAAAERGAPESVIRAGIRRTIGARLTAESGRDVLERDEMLGRWHRGPIRSRVEHRGLHNVQHIVRDVNALELEGRFDAVVSLEMLEHVRNHPALLEQVASALQPDAQVFVHVFAHRDLFWEFEDRGRGYWMARTFFSGGIMPSRTDIRRLVAPFAVEESWWENGLHYQKTLEAWLGLLDAHRAEVARALSPVYGAQTDLWLQRWRIFLMACSEFFGYSGGDLLGVSHHRLRLE